MLRRKLKRSAPTSPGCLSWTSDRPTSTSAVHKTETRAVQTVEVLRLGLPSADEDTVVGEGRDVETQERITFIVPPDQRLRVLAEARRASVGLDPPFLRCGAMGCRARRRVGLR